MKRFIGRATCKIVLTLNLCLLINALPSMQGAKLSNDLVNDESDRNWSGSDARTTRSGLTNRNNDQPAQSKCGYEVRIHQSVERN